MSLLQLLEGTRHVLTYNLHLRIGSGCRVEGSIGGDFAAEISGEAEADITYKHQGCVRAALLQV